MAQERGLTNERIVNAARAGRFGINKRESFQTYPVDTFRARFGYLAPHLGWMPRSWQRIYRERYSAGKVLQALVSFETTIAWKDADYGWIMPDVNYSPITSSKHQGPAYRLYATRHAMPYDATLEDARRVLAGELVFTSKGCGKSRVFTGTAPGPNYIPEV